MSLEEQVEEEQGFKQQWGIISKKILLLDKSKGLTRAELSDYGQPFLKRIEIDGQEGYIIENPVDKTMSFSFIKRGEDGEVLYYRFVKNYGEKNDKLW